MRSGFAAGDPALIAALKAFRPTVGTAPQEFVQRASVVAWGDEEHVAFLAGDLHGGSVRAGDNVLFDSRSIVVTELLPREEVEELVLEEIPDVTYEDIGGLEGQIEHIRDAVELPFLYAELYAEHQLDPPKGVLLYGPPGCGKTLIAKAVA